jgi:hypothetical protein
MARKKHGGKREGAGRKAVGRVKIQFKLKPSTIAAVKAAAADKQVTNSDIVEGSLEETLRPNLKKY